MDRRVFVRASLSALALGSVPSWAQGELLARGRWVSRMRPAMGSFVEISIYSHQQEYPDRIIEACFESIEADIAEISNWRSESPITELNRTGEIGGSELSPAVREIVAASELVRATSHGLYEPYCHALTLLWRAARAETRVPALRDVTTLAREAARTTVEIKADRIRLHGAGTLDVNGIGQGWIADRAVSFLQSHGIELARVDCCGDMRFLGRTDWRVSVEHPRQDGILGEFSVVGGVGVGTSGDYRTLWEKDGTSYHHLIDPYTGYPSHNCQLCVVVHRSAALADALATGLFQLSPAQAMELARTAGAEALFVDRGGAVHLTPKIARSFVRAAL